MDVLDAEVQQGQQDDDSLLLVPSNVEDERQLVDIIKTEDFLELERDQREAVGVVALASIEDARDAADVAEVHLDVLVLRAASRQDDRILRQSLGELCVVLAALHAAIAASHDDELLDGTALNGLDNLVGHGEDLRMCKAADNLALLELLRGLALLGHLDDRAEVLRAVCLRLDVRAAREADSARREDAVLVGILRRNEAVRRQDDRAVERLELFLLLPPSIAVVADEVLVVLELRIVVSRQHLAVRVDVDARAFRLLEQHLEVAQIVARDQDARVLAHAEVNLRDFWIAVSLRVRRVEQSHAVDAELARLECESRQLLSRLAVVEQARECRLDECIDGLVLLIEDVGVLDIGSEALEAVRRELAQAADILVLRGEDADLLGLLVKAVAAVAVERCFRQVLTARKRCEALSLDLQRRLDGLDDGLAVEVRIRDRDEEVLRHEVVDLASDLLALSAQARRDSGEAFRHVDEQVLHRCDFRLLAADAYLRAALAASRFLTLKAKHLIFHDQLSLYQTHIGFSFH